MRLLRNRTWYQLHFAMGINNGLRVGDLLQLKVGQLRNMKPGQSIPVRPGKIGNVNVLMMNRSPFKVLMGFLEELSPADYDCLFKSANRKN